MLYKKPYDKIISEITAKCWKDAEFKQRFLADPAAVIREFGVEVPEGINIKVVEDDSPKKVTLHLPPAPSSELSDQDLEAVSGGKMTAEEKWERDKKLREDGFDPIWPNF